MNRTLLTLALVAWGSSSPVYCQAPPEKAVGEDIEIMRHILQKRLLPVAMTTRTCQQCHAVGKTPEDHYQSMQLNQGVVWFSNTGRTNLSNIPGHAHGFGTTEGLTVEGIRLPGYGLVFTVSAPLPFRDPRPQSSEPPTKAPSTWEKARLELLGKEVPREWSPTKQPTTIGDVIANLFAENGHHLETLAPEDKVTIVVTFRGKQGVSAREKAASRPPKSNPMSSQQTQPKSVPFLGTVPAPGLTLTQPLGNRQLDSKEQLGDLHTRNGQYREAIRVYEDLLQNHRADSNKVKRIIGKLIQVYIAAGEFSKGAKLLDTLTQFSKKEKKLVPSTPGRMTISTTKKTLDRVGKKEITLEAFRDALEVAIEPLPGIDSSSKQTSSARP